MVILLCIGYYMGFYYIGYYYMGYIIIYKGYFPTQLERREWGEGGKVKNLRSFR